MCHQYSQVTDQSDESAEAESVAHYSSMPRVVTQEYFDKTLETMMEYEKNAQEAVKLGKNPMDWSFHFHSKLDWLEQHLKNDSEGLADTSHALLRGRLADWKRSHLRFDWKRELGSAVLQTADLQTAESSSPPVSSTTPREPRASRGRRGHGRRNA